MAQELLSFALGIPHAPWKAGRVESMRRLESQLGDRGGRRLVLAGKAPNYVWSESMWKWAAEGNTTHFLTLQDDAIVSPRFWSTLEAMVAARPDDVIGLEAAHPHGPNVTGCWYTTDDMLIGVAYVVPIPALRLFLAWRSVLRKGSVETMNEDQLLGLWCFATGRRIWHPVPTIVDHDVSLDSTYANDGHQHRRPTVLWTDRPEPESWTLDESGPRVRTWNDPPTPADVPHFGKFYRDTPKLARRWIVGMGEEDLARWIG